VSLIRKNSQRINSAILKSKNTLASFILVVVYTVGIIGIRGNFDERFVLLTPVNLLLSLGLIFWTHPGTYSPLWKLAVLCFTTGLLVEIAGVQTGLIFGDYQYGEVLGPKIWGTPLMIGVNWTMLVYGAGSTVNRLVPDQNIWIKAGLGAMLMTILDVLIEPVAMNLNFWNWQDDIITLQNYFAWFFVALPLLASYFKLLGKTTNKVAILLFILQFIFFGILQL